MTAPSLLTRRPPPRRRKRPRRGWGIFASRTVWAGIAGALGILGDAPALTIPVLLKAGAAAFGAMALRSAIQDAKDAVATVATAARTGEGTDDAGDGR